LPSLGSSALVFYLSIPDPRLDREAWHSEIARSTLVSKLIRVLAAERATWRHIMTANRRTATIVGALFLIAMAASLVGGAMVEGILAAPDYLAQATGNTTTLALGIILELVNALAVIGIAVAFFPLFRKNGEGAALGYVGLRILEAVALAAAAFIPATLVSLGRQSAGAEPAAMASIAVLGKQLLATRADLLGIMVPLFFCLGAILLYTWLLRSQLLPRFIPIWGLLGVVGIAAVNLLAVGTAVAMILALPIILNEVFLGGWLLFRGFSATPAVSRRSVAA